VKTWFPAWVLLLPLASQAQEQPADSPVSVSSYFTADFQPTSAQDSTAYCAETTFYNGPRGVTRVYYPSGRLKQYIPFANVARQVKHGTATTWYEDGQLCIKEAYLNGVRTSELVTYYPDGTLKRQEQYENGHCGIGRCYDPDGRPVPYFVYEQLPLYPGGDAQLLKELERGARLTPREMNSMSTEGRWPLPAGQEVRREVDVQLAVAADGRITGAQVVQSTSRMLSAAALRAVGKLRRQFVPGQRDGQRMNSYLTVPVYFTIYNPARPSYGPARPYGRWR
jgi:protein TonB